MAAVVNAVVVDGLNFTWPTPHIWCAFVESIQQAAYLRPNSGLAGARNLKRNPLIGRFAGLLRKLNWAPTCLACQLGVHLPPCKPLKLADLWLSQREPASVSRPPSNWAAT